MLRIVDVAGQQVADLICFRLDDYGDKLSVHNTLLLNQTIYITTGHTLQSTECTTMMTIVEDTVGVHDLIAGSCSEHTNAVRYGVRGTPNCRRNFELALEVHGIPMREIPYSFNIFINVPVTDSNEDHRARVGTGDPSTSARKSTSWSRSRTARSSGIPAMRSSRRSSGAGLRAVERAGVRHARPTVTSTATA